MSGAYKNAGRWKIGLIAASALLFFGVIYVAVPMFGGEAPQAMVALPLTLCYVLAVYLLAGKRAMQLETIPFLFVLALLALAFFVRVPLLSYRSSDYVCWNEKWIEQARAIPGFGALSQEIGNYNAPYFYLVFIVAKLCPGSAQLFLLKFFSLLFDIFAAFFVMRLCALHSKRYFTQFTAALIVLFLPTVVLNGAYWGQCDSIYTTFGLAALYYGLKKRSRASVAMFALMLSFKLQAVFLYPLLAAFLLTGRVRWRDLWVLPATILASLLPALFAGRSLQNLLLVYVGQTGEYGGLSMNAPNIFGLFNDLTYGNPALGYAGIMFALTLCVALIGCLYYRRERLDDTAWIEAALLFALIVPYLLPYMHERYFFLADLISVAYAFRYPKRIAVPFTVVLCSLFSYPPFLLDRPAPVPMSVLSIALLIVIGFVLTRFLERMEAPRSLKA